MLKSKRGIVSCDNDLCFMELGWFKCCDIKKNKGTVCGVGWGGTCTLSIVRH